MQCRSTTDRGLDDISVRVTLALARCAGGGHCAACTGRAGRMQAMHSMQLAMAWEHAASAPAAGSWRSYRAGCPCRGTSAHWHPCQSAAHRCCCCCCCCCRCCCRPHRCSARRSAYSSPAGGRRSSRSCTPASTTQTAPARQHAAPPQRPQTHLLHLMGASYTG